MDVCAHPRDVRHHARRRRETTKELAFNQGFYNLFLAIMTAVGVAIGGSAITASRRH